MHDLLPRLRDSLAGRYGIEREVGRGGMATVFLAEDLRHRRRVALKVLDPHLAASIGDDRFLREIETVARLTHPHILPLFDSGVADGLLFYVMPFVEGGSLRQRIEREKQLPVVDALEIAREVSDALGNAHHHQVVHRDVKPENILIADRHALLADFGVAWAALEGRERLTGTGATVGTPEYMSPEQAAGDPQPDGRSDQYGLACVLYEMLAGQPPFTGPTAESILYQHLHAVPRPVTDLRRAIPRSVENALAKALSKDAADRFAADADFAAALLADGPENRTPGASAGFGSTAEPVTRRRGFSIWFGAIHERGRRSLWFSAGISFAVVAAFGAAMFSVARRAPSPSEKFPTPREITRGGPIIPEGGTGRWNRGARDASPPPGLVADFHKYVANPFAATLAGKYPLVASGPDASKEDFDEYFRPGGTFWSFYEHRLVHLLNPDGTPITSSDSVPPPKLMVFVRRAFDIRQALFPSDSRVSVLRLRLRARPIELEGPGVEVTRTTLRVGGASIVSDAGLSAWTELEWPGSAGEGATLTVETRSGPADSLTQSGTWGFLRLIESAERVPGGDRTETVTWRLRSGATRVRVAYEIESAEGALRGLPDLLRVTPPSLQP